MAELAIILAWLVAAVLVIPPTVLTIELLAALLPRRPSDDLSARPRCAVLIPAHDEETGLAATLANVRLQLLPGDRLLVVADNCTDHTADIARAAGAEVVERRDEAHRAKGFALDFGVRTLAADAPAVVVVIDADCVVHEGGIDRLVRRAAATGRPVQAIYTLDPPETSGPRQRMAAFAFRVKNEFRPTGLARLGLPCLLTGSGMAFPWEVLAKADLAHGDVAEDTRLGVELAAAGSPPCLEESARVTGELAATGPGIASQRRRWEHGHVAILLRRAPRLAWAAIRRGRPGLIALALELSVPPLALLMIIETAALAGLTAYWLFGGPVGPAVLHASGGLATGAALFITWLFRGRDVLPLRDLAVAPLYVLAKVPLYFAFLFKPQRAWVRTDRGPPNR